DTTINLTDVANANCNIALTASTTVTVNALPVASAITGPTEVCVSETIDLTEGTTGAINWTSSDVSIATIDANGVVTGVDFGTVNIYYEVTDANGCTSLPSADYTITVGPSTDSDGDGLTDCEETTGIDDPSTPEVPIGISDENDPCDPMHTVVALTDTDGDGLTDCEETTGIDNPATPEVPTGTSDENDPCDPMHTAVALTDADGDGLTDCEETTGIDNPATPEVPTGTSDEND
ncbi:Ig-like domain-containing protein, partial [Flavivirga algicola]